MIQTILTIQRILIIILNIFLLYNTNVAPNIPNLAIIPSSKNEKKSTYEPQASIRNLTKTRNSTHPKFELKFVS
jgi:hypothetical protein